MKLGVDVPLRLHAVLDDTHLITYRDTLFTHVERTHGRIPLMFISLST
jgi:hypothetical protein